MGGGGQIDPTTNLLKTKNNCQLRNLVCLKRRLHIKEMPVSEFSLINVSIGKPCLVFGVEKQIIIKITIIIMNEDNFSWQCNIINTEK